MNLSQRLILGLILAMTFILVASITVTLEILTSNQAGNAILIVIFLYALFIMSGSNFE